MPPLSPHSGPGSASRAAGARMVLADSFERDLPLGGLVGSTAPDGTVRGGRDREGAMGADHGAARIRCLVDPGWGHASLAYGPFPAEPGLTLAVHLVNGLNTSQTSPLPEGRAVKVRRLLRNLPRLVWNEPVLRDNLAVGWFADLVPAHPPTGGDCFLNGPGPGPDGELRRHAAGRTTRLRDGVQNLPVVLVVVLREGSTAFYAASLPGARAYGPYPELRPLGVALAADRPAMVHAGVHQSILGEVRYRLDTRIDAVRAAVLDECASWDAWSLAADRFDGAGPVEGTSAGSGPAWAGSGLLRTAGGATAPGGNGDARLGLTEAAGVVHAVIVPGDQAGGAASGPGCALRWRSDGSGAWALRLGSAGASLLVEGPGGVDELARDPLGALTAGATHEVEILDDGVTVGAYLDGRLLFDAWFDDARHADATGVGVSLEGDRSTRIARFEVQPRAVRLPPVLEHAAPWLEEGEVDVLVDRFGSGEPADLAGRSVELGGSTWRRVMGEATFDLAPPGLVAVRADPAHPAPGRTVYALDWPDPAFVDVAVTITPPGRERGDGNAGRAGLVLWQDEGNHLVFNNWIDDGLPGRSISVFLRTGGHEEMFDWDAVWSNVNGRIRRGVPYRLRVCSDGTDFVCFVDGEPVCARAVPDYRPEARPLALRMVGLTVNWEWGDDTGSTFRDFVARGRSRETSR